MDFLLSGRRKFRLSLPQVPIKNTWVSDLQEDFVFISGGRTYHCPRILSHFLSPKLRLLHSVDPSILEYIVETEDSDGLFGMFLALGTGSIDVTERQSDFFISLSRELGNISAFLSLLDHFHPGYDDDHRLHQLSSLSFSSDRSIDVISSQLYQLSPSQLDHIPLPLLYHILSRPCLQISSEDDLFSHICSRISENADYSDLLQFVRFEFLSPESLSDFVAMDPVDVDRRLWRSLSRRLTFRLRGSFSLEQNGSVNGIIAYLTWKYGGNVHDNGIVTIHTDAADPNVCSSVRNVANLNSGLSFQSLDCPSGKVSWHFCTGSVIPTHYTIRGGLRSWRIESSMDGEHWMYITDPVNSDALRQWPHAASFPVSKSCECRWIRLTQTGHNFSGNNRLTLDAFELFGDFME
jgi:hypothetical protein